MNTNRRHAVAALIAAGLLWGTTVPLSKLALEWLSPGWLTAARFGLAAAVLLAATPRAKLRAAFTPKVLVAGALGYGGSVMVQNAGITRTSVTHAALLIGAVPVLVAIIAAVWHRTVARPVAWIGFVVSLGGVGLVTVGGGGGGATMIGDGLVLASLFLSAAVTVAQGRLFIGRDPVAVTAVQFLGATLGALLVTVLTEGAPAVPSGPGPVLAVVALAAFGTLVPFTLFAFGQSRVSAEVAGAFLNLEPLVGAIAGAAAFGDPVGLALFAGGAAIVAGIGLSSLPLLAGRRRSQAAPLALVAASPAAAGGGPLALASGPAPLALAAGPEPLAPALAAGLSGYGRDSLPNRGSRLPHPCHDPAHPGRRNGVFVVVYGGKFGAGGPGDTRPGPGRAGPRRHGGTRRGGAPSGRPPGRRRGRRPNPGMGPAASGRRAIGDRGRSWPGASRVDQRRGADLVELGAFVVVENQGRGRQV
jgi:O-acetylserine/cysteine efflux transporter